MPINGKCSINAISSGVNLLVCKISNIKFICDSDFFTKRTFRKIDLQTNGDRITVPENNEFVVFRQEM